MEPTTSHAPHHMRASLLSIALLVSACHGASPRAESQRVRRTAAWDSATVIRLCESPDSVIAGKKDCVLLDQRRGASGVGQPPPDPR